VRSLQEIPDAVKPFVTSCIGFRCALPELTNLKVGQHVDLTKVVRIAWGFE
jgi:hypothetical protein